VPLPSRFHAFDYSTVDLLGQFLNGWVIAIHQAAHMCDGSDRQGACM